MGSSEWRGGGWKGGENVYVWKIRRPLISSGATRIYILFFFFCRGFLVLFPSPATYPRPNTPVIYYSNIAVTQFVGRNSRVIGCSCTLFASKVLFPPPTCIFLCIFFTQSKRGIWFLLLHVLRVWEYGYDRVTGGDAGNAVKSIFTNLRSCESRGGGKKVQNWFNRCENGIRGGQWCILKRIYTIAPGFGLL